MLRNFVVDVRSRNDETYPFITRPVNNLYYSAPIPSISRGVENQQEPKQQLVHVFDQGEDSTIKNLLYHEINKSSNGYIKIID